MLALFLYVSNRVCCCGEELTNKINSETYKQSCFSHDCMTIRICECCEMVIHVFHLRDGGTINSVVFIAGHEFTSRGSGVRGGDSGVWHAWFAAIRQIMLRVFPSPMSSARRPPRNCGGASS
jgi:hypothetical protein